MKALWRLAVIVLLGVIAFRSIATPAAKAMMPGWYQVSTSCDHIKAMSITPQTVAVVCEESDDTIYWKAR